jgi:predicted membrane protein
MTATTKRILSTGGMLALGLIFMGALMLIANFGLLGHTLQIWDFWPVVIIFAGLGLVIQAQDYIYYLDGVMLMLAGAIILNENIRLFHWRHMGWDLIWPLLLVYAGVRILLFGSRSHHFFENHVFFNAEDFHVVALFGGGEYRYDNKQLKDGKIVTIFGGCKADLRSADFEGDSIGLKCVALFGGIELLVPRHWEVIVNGLPIFGGIANKAQYDAGQAARKRLLIEGVAIMGGIEIKN